MRAVRSLWAALALVATVLVAGCSLPAAGTSVDGWELGEPVVCNDEMSDVCDASLGVAVRGFDESAQGHVPILQMRLYNQVGLTVRSGGPVLIAVFQLADGSTRALGVGRLGISGPVPFDAPDQPRWPGGTPP